jgi:hypothetical protein
MGIQVKTQLSITGQFTSSVIKPNTKYFRGELDEIVEEKY